MHTRKRKGGIMESFLDNVNQMIIDAEIQTISEQLFDNWMAENLNDGQFWADYRFAEMSDSQLVKDEFHKFYGISKGEDMYLC